MSSSTHNNNHHHQSRGPVYVLYGSATGNAEHIAKAFAVQLQNETTTTKSNRNDGEATACGVVVCAELDAWKKKCPLLLGLAAPATASASSTTTSASQRRRTPEGVGADNSSSSEKPPPQQQPPQSQQQRQQQEKCTVLVVASTTGNGDPPENASRFVRTLKRAASSHQNHNGNPPLKNVAFAVLGLGDTNYDNFCAVGKLLDKKLADLGAARLLPLACADEATGLEEVVEPWTASVLNLLKGVPKAVEKKEDGPAASVTPVVPRIQDPTATTTTPTTGGDADPTHELNGDAPPNPPTATPSSSSSSSSSSSIGVLTVKSLLGIPMDAPLEEEDEREDFRAADRPGSVPATPRIPHALSQCELYHPDNDESGDHDDADAGADADADDVLDATGRRRRRKSRGMSVADDTVSTASTGFLYHAQNPYPSQILRARYLTQTDPTPLLADLTKLPSDMDNDDSARVAATMELIDRHFGPDAIDHDVDDSTSTSNNNTRTKRVLELTLQLPDDTTIEYEPGDSLGVVVHNPHDDVRFVLDVVARQGLQASTLLLIDQNKRMTAREAVASALDVSTPGVPRRILHVLSQQVEVLTPEDRAALRLLSAPTKRGSDAYRAYVEGQRLTLVDILREFPSTQSVPWRSLFGMLTGIPPRYYSVSSSPLAMTHSLTIAFSVVDYRTPSLIVNGRERGLRRIRGVATRYMEALVLPLLATPDPRGGESTPADEAASPQLRIFPKPTTEFRMPASLHDPLILIGPGTGIAPFMGFVAHRQALVRKRQQVASERPRTAAETVVEGAWRGGFDLDEHELPVTPRDAIRHAAMDDNRPTQDEKFSDIVGAVDVYFGCRHKDHDWLYREEMMKFHADGAISNLYTAFSRDAPRKVYVQHLMQRGENQARIADLILSCGARVYLCGDGNAMAKDVQETLIEVLASHLPGGFDEARGYFERMRHDRRFLVDIWS